jgi:hypothetical protein
MEWTDFVARMDDETQGIYYLLKFLTIFNAPKRYTLHFLRVRKIAKSDYSLRHVYLSARPTAWTTLLRTARIFMVSEILRYFFRKSVGKIQALLKFDENDGYFK